MNRLTTAVASVILAWIVGYLLIAGKGLLIPIIVSIFIWHLLNSTSNAMHRIPFIGHRLPDLLCMVLALVVVGFFVKLLVDIISTNVSQVILASSRYQEKLMHIFEQIT